jgi:hypothetical protein
MNVKRIVTTVVTLLSVACVVSAVSAAPDVVPAPGAPPLHLRVSVSGVAADGPRATTADFILRRTGLATAALQRDTDVTPLVVMPDGSLQLTPGATDPTLDDVLAALNSAHGVVGAAGAGSSGGWAGAIPLPRRAQPIGAPSPAPAPPLPVQIRAVASTGGILDIDGSAETTLAGNASGKGGQRSQRFHGMGGGGGFGGGRGGFGGGRGGGPGGGNSGGDDPPDDGGSPAGPPSAQMTLDVHVTGRIERQALAHLTIAQTRRVVLDGLSYSNVASATIDVVR